MYTKTRIIILLLVVSFVSCTRNKFILDDIRDDGRDSTSISSGNGKSSVKIYPKIRGLNSGGSVMFPEGARAALFAYKDTNYVEWRLYQSLAPGTLSPLKDQMILMNGLYNFYLVSDKNGTNPPTFKNSVATGLQNGVDYLYGAINNYDLNQNVTLAVEMEHSGTQITLTIDTVGSHLKNMIIDSCKIETPVINDNVFWSLTTGQINPAHNISKDMLEMTVSNLFCQQVLVPLMYGGNIGISLVVNVNNESSNRTYKIELPIPGGAFWAGNCYEFKVQFNLLEVIFENVSIKDWTEVDEEGTPIVIGGTN